MNLRYVFPATAAIAALMLAAPVQAKEARVKAKAHTVVTDQDVKWAPGPASIPPGAEAAVLYGDPSKKGLFAMRLRLPKGYAIAPHMHPRPEVVTVISGTFRIGMGKKADESKGQALPAGGFIALPPGTAHFASADDDTVIQLNSNGPWKITYINPKDDPRKKK